MSLGEGSLKVGGPVVQKAASPLEVNMATKRILTTQYPPTERVQWNT